MFWGFFSSPWMVYGVLTIATLLAVDCFFGWRWTKAIIDTFAEYPIYDNDLDKKEK